MEWFFTTNKSFSEKCPEEKVVELTEFLLSNKYVPFAWGLKEDTIVRLNPSNHGKDWFSNSLIWLHQPSLPNHLAKNSSITLSSKLKRLIV